MNLVLKLLATLAFIPAIISGQSYGDTATCVCKYSNTVSGGYGYGAPIESIAVSAIIEENWSPADDDEALNLNKPRFSLVRRPYGSKSSRPGAYGYGMSPPMPAPPPTLFGPCVHVTSNIANSWINGDQPYTNYQYAVRVDNQCSKPIYQQYVYAKPFGNITETWNVDVQEDEDGVGTFSFPLWASTFGIPAGGSLNFGFISINQVSVSREKP